MEKIIPIWQPVGYSTHRIARAVAAFKGFKTSHTGTIDPMAEGVVIVLVDDERLKKYDYAHWLKEYEFSIVFGISTDTYDGMGIYSEDLSLNCDVNEDILREVLTSFVGKYTQTIPPFSTIKVKGKNMFKYKREDALPKELPTREGEVKEIELLSLSRLPLSEIVSDITSRVEKIPGDFRQDEIISKWGELDKSGDVFVANIRVLMTKGLYVRTLSQDIGEKMNVPCFIYKLVRTKNGEFGRDNSKTLDELFGSGYNRKNLMPGVMSLFD